MNGYWLRAAGCGAGALIAGLLVGCARSSPPRPSPRPDNSALSAELVQIGREDQAGRDSVAIALAANDTAFIFRMMRGDSARTRRLREIIATSGWPRVAQVGKEAASAAWLVVQHSPLLAFQEEMLPQLEALSKTGEISRADVAMLTDRVLVGQGKPQRYGNSFAIVNGKFIAHPIEDIAHLEERRAAMGLPPMAEYVKMLAEAYNAPVEWPPHP